MNYNTMKNTMFNNIALVGDEIGIPQLTRHIPKSLIKCIVIAEIRPQAIEFLSNFARRNRIKLLIQSDYKTKKYQQFINNFQKLNIDLLLCFSYSMIIRKDILKMVNFNAFNIHTSLLPKNRGPNPIQWAIIRGENVTGVTIHYMNENIDSGDIIAQKKIRIDFKDTWVTLRNKISKITDKMVKEHIPNILKGNIKRYRQNENIATYNQRLTADSPRIDFDKMNDRQIYDLIRAQVVPLKGAFIEMQNQRIYFKALVTFSKIKELRKKYER